MPIHETRDTDDFGILGRDARLEVTGCFATVASREGHDRRLVDAVVDKSNLAVGQDEVRSSGMLTPKMIVMRPRPIAASKSILHAQIGIQRSSSAERPAPVIAVGNAAFPHHQCAGGSVSEVSQPRAAVQIDAAVKPRKHGSAADSK